MYRVAWLTSVLLTVAGVGARIYGRCELAHDLLALGVDPDHVSTWVCIAWHESRFDTAANNPHSGDHGIFQISELYWCGPGKACGVPCHALRDEDISNDLECALQVHEEHTRLQGNGFLAWVVYPQHCKHSTKKYVVGCDTSAKMTVPITRSRVYENSYNKPNVTFARHNVEALLPPYLAINSIFRGSYGKVFDSNRNRVDWTKYKIADIDSLKLPMLNKPLQAMMLSPPTTIGSTPSPTTTTTTVMTTTEYIPPVKPWRTIETNQFRKKKIFNDTSTNKPTIRNEYSTKSITMPTSRFTESELILTTIQPHIKAKLTAASTSTTPKTTPSITTTTTTTTPIPVTTTLTTKIIPLTTKITTTPSYSSKNTTILKLTTKPWTYRTTPQKLPTTTMTTPKATSIYRRRTTTTIIPSTTTTRKSTTLKSRTRASWYTSTQSPFISTNKPKSDFSWYTFKSRTASTTPVPTTRSLQTQQRITNAYTAKTARETIQTTPSLAQPVTTTSKPQTTSRKPRTTQSIFDLYLNPTKPPRLPVIKFNSASSSKYGLQIFAGGTTTPAPTRPSIT